MISTRKSIYPPLLVFKYVRYADQFVPILLPLFPPVNKLCDICFSFLKV